jgi:hypothetical protein
MDIPFGIGAPGWSMERKTGPIKRTTRKTAALKRAENARGAAPLHLAAAAFGICSEILGFFSLYYGLRDNRLLLLVLSSILAPIAGGVVWNRLCARNHWTFFTGGAGREPYGPYAFLWGFVTMLPIIFSVQILDSNYVLNNKLAVAGWFFSREFGLILSYSFFSGVAAMFIFGFRAGRSLRTRLARRSLQFETLELMLVAIWTIVFATIPTLSMGLFADARMPRLQLSLHSIGYLAPVLLSLVACLLLLSGYFHFADYKRLDPKGMFKTVLTEFGFRFSFFWGLWLLRDERHLAGVIAVVKAILRKPFDPLW